LKQAKHYREDRYEKVHRDDRGKHGRDHPMMRKSESFDSSIKGAKKELYKKVDRYDRGDRGSREGPSNTPRLGPSKDRLSITATPSKIFTKTLPESEAKEIEENTRRIFNSLINGESSKEECLEEFKKLKYGPNTMYYVIYALALAIIDKAKYMNDLFTFLLGLRDEKLVQLDDFEKGLGVALGFLIETEMVMDAPKTFQIFGNLIGRCVFEQLLTFDSVQLILETYHAQKDALKTKETIEVMINMLTTIIEKEEYSNEKPAQKEKLCKSSFNFLHIFKKREDQEKYARMAVEKCDKLEVIAHIMCFVMDHSEDNSADRTLLQWLHDNMGDDATLSTAPYATKIFSALLAAGEALNRISDIVHHFNGTYSAFLDHADDFVRAQCIREIHIYCNNVGGLGRFEALLKEFSFSANVLRLWYEDKNDKTVGREKAMLAVKNLF
jgi:hypothetical protein